MRWADGSQDRVPALPQRRRTDSTQTWYFALLMGLILGAALALPISMGLPVHRGSMIGGTHIPSGLQCQEDEVISFTDIDKLGCVHIENILTSEVR